MPNHVYTSMQVTGEPAAVTAFIEKHVTDNQFDLNTFLPMPEELEGTVSPCDPNPTLREKYGADNWYDWTVSNWGTKWNTYDGDCDDIGNGTAVLNFQTAWSLPDPIFAKMAEMYPTLTFNIECVEEGGFFAGTILISEGKVKENLTNDTETWKRYAEEFMGWSFDDEE